MGATGQKKNEILDIFHAAIAAVQPSELIPQVLNIKGDRLQVGEDIFSLNEFSNIYVAGAGKATASMANEVEKILTHHISEGVIAMKDTAAFNFKIIRTIVAGHPLPNENSLIAGEEINKLLNKLTQNDLLIFLLSGGASSLLFDVPAECSLEEVSTVIDQLMRKGADIHELNIVRKHLSELKGGQLVKKCNGATVISLIISDVTGSDLQSIGSGYTVGDDSTFADALNVLKKFDLFTSAPYAVKDHLTKGVNGNIPENPRPNDKLFNNTRNNIIADNKKALEAAGKKANALGYEAIIVTDNMTGFAEDAASDWVKRIPVNTSDKVCLIAGGETTVHVRGSGKGGRTQQLALAAAVALKNSSDITLLAAGTDGSDGPTDAAGAIVTSSTYNDAKQLGLIAEDYLNDNDAYRFFEQTGGIVKTGPTNTNVMDIVITLVH